MCPGVVLKTLAVPFDPKDSRWSALYQACLANFKPSGYAGECRRLCSEVASTSNTLRLSQGIDSCALDCSKPDTPVLSVTYSDTLCEVSSPEPPLDAAVERVTDAAEERPLDARPLLDGAGGADGGGAPQVVLRKSYAWANCMPSSGSGTEDPVMVTWTVDIAGARGDTARVSKATLTVVGAITIVQTFSVDKPTISLVAGAGSAEQRKPLPGTSPNTACTQICGGASKGSYRLELVFDVDGQSIAVESSGSFVCSY
jgi:hypothetical protein